MQNQKQNNNLVWLGTIVNTHGLKGEVRILSNTDDLELRFKPGSSVYLANGEELKIKSYRLHKKFILVFFDSFNHINDVEKFKSQEIYTDKLETEIVDFYYKDLIGYLAMDQNKKEIGKIENYFDQGPYYSFLIKLNTKGTINFPIIDEFVGEINNKNKVIVFNVDINDYLIGEKNG